MKKLSQMVLLVVLLVVPVFCYAEGSKFILLASTIGPIDAGIVDVLETAFEKESGIRVRHVGAGTGATLDLARKGQFDLVMVHAKALEEKFVNDGYGKERIPLMYNDFVIVGPAEDPAGVRGVKTATEALKMISDKSVTFISRGDKSGTHIAEMGLWEKANIKPTGAWYVVYEKGAEGNVATLRFTDQKGAYTVIDRATFLTLKDQIKLVVLLENDEALLNHISLIPVNQKKFNRINYGDAMKFVKWLTSPDKGQKIISTFGKEKYGSPLFFPESIEWQKVQSQSQGQQK